MGMNANQAGLLNYGNVVSQMGGVSGALGGGMGMGGYPAMPFAQPFGQPFGQPYAQPFAQPSGMPMAGGYPAPMPMPTVVPPAQTMPMPTAIPPMGGMAPVPMPTVVPPQANRPLPQLPSIQPSSVAPGGRESAAIQWAHSLEGVNERQNPDTVRSISRGRWQAWCADFVSQAFQNTGGAPWGHRSSVSGIMRWGQENGRYFAKEAQLPQPGDVIIMKNGISHTGIVTRVENGQVHTIEGNSNNSVRQRSYDLNAPRITGYVRPFGAV